ncbi:fimbrial protein [Enterobacter cloacae]|uniref:fimbrial protein n=1 Tax=Enterobacter cloacae TaxID=550 RepID=UPI0034A2B27E
MINYLRKSCLLILIFHIPGISHAVVNCKVSPTQPMKDDTVTLTGNITVGEDIPVGTIIYRAGTNVDGFAGVYCDAAFSLDNVREFESLRLPLSSWQGGAASGKIYQTDIPGIGVAVRVAEGYTPLRDSAYFIRDSAGSRGRGRNRIILFIKTGPVSPGVISGSNLPTLRDYIPATPGYTGLPLTTARLRFSGSLTVRAPTCKTPDVTVNLGTHEISQKFKGKGSYTDWVSANIPFECSAGFTGYYPSGNNTISIAGSGTLPAGTPTNNQLTLTIKPLNEAIDAANGIMAVDKKDGAATGIGIQLNTPNNGWENLPAEGNVDFNKPLSWSIINSRPVYWPLRARYIQTTDKVTPGPANGKIVFTINYK